MNPLARTNNLVTEDIWDEVVVYDELDNRVHRLNRTAAMVWRHCDGTRSQADLASVLNEHLDVRSDESLVQLALDDLSDAGLLVAAATRGGSGTLSRRELLGKLTVAASMLPVVASIVAPLPIAAASFSSPTSPTTPTPTPPTSTTITPVGGVTLNGTGTRGTASCNGDFGPTESLSCTFNSNLSACTLVVPGMPTQQCTGTPPVAGTSPTAVYNGTGLAFPGFSGSFSLTATWTANQTINYSHSINITASGGCPAIYTGVCR